MLIEMVIISIISLIILMIRKRKTVILSKIDIEIKGYKIIIIMAIIEITAQFLFKRFNNSNLLQILSLNWLIYLGILIIAIINIKKHYMKIFLIGTLLNFIAIITNNFKMPVLVSESLLNYKANILFLKSGQDLVHSLLTDATHFKILCDIITLPPPYPFVKAISIGDVFLLIGVFIFWQETFSNKERENA